MTEKAKNLEAVKSNKITVLCREGEDASLAAARMLVGPHITNARVAAQFAKGNVGEVLPLQAVVTAFTESAKRVNVNDLTDVEATLHSQSATLNIMFGEMSRRAALNMGEYPEAAERYMRMALKAQNQCRMTLETLSNIKNPPVVYARQANISNGPQQVNNTLHAHTGENQNPPSKVLEQSNEQRMDSPAQSATFESNSKLETVDASNGAKIS
jgi:hypothetical protein